MAVSQLFNIYAVKVGSTVLGGITSQSANLGTMLDSQPTSGSPDVIYQAVLGQNPTASFSTLHVAAALDLVGTKGASIADLTGGVTFYGYKRAEGGTRETEDEHITYTVNEGIIFPQTLSASHQGNAELSIGLAITYDGSNDPIAKLDDQAIATAPASGDEERFTLGPVDLAGVTLAQIQNLSLNFGLNVETQGSDSEIWPTYASVSDQAPVLTVDGLDPDWHETGGSNIIHTGRTGLHADTIFYLRKRAAGGTFTADATAEHIKFTAAGHVTPDDLFSGGGNSPMTTGLVMPLRRNTTSEPLTLDTTSAIS